MHFSESFTLIMLSAWHKMTPTRATPMRPFHISWMSSDSTTYTWPHFNRYILRSVKFHGTYERYRKDPMLSGYRHIKRSDFLFSKHVHLFSYSNYWARVIATPHTCKKSNIWFPQVVLWLLWSKYVIMFWCHWIKLDLLSCNCTLQLN